MNESMSKLRVRDEKLQVAEEITHQATLKQKEVMELEGVEM